MSKKKKAKKRAAKQTKTNKVTTRSSLKELTGLQKRFVDILHSMKKPEKLKAFNLAGYKSTGKVGSTEACKTLNLPHVRAYYDSLRQKATERAERTSDEIIAELEKIAFSKKRDILKVRSLELLGRRFGLFPNKQNIQLGLSKETATLLGLIDGSSKGKLPTNEEIEEAGK